MIAAEATVKFATIIKVEILENSASRAFVRLIYSLFAVQASVFAKGVNVCATDPNSTRVDGLVGIDW